MSAIYYNHNYVCEDLRAVSSFSHLGRESYIDENPTLSACIECTFRINTGK